MTKKITYLVLTPEASTNWLFDDLIIFDIFSNNYRVVMDQDDYDRYKKLSAKSDLDFFKHFFLSLLEANDRLILVDYKKIYKEKLIKKSNEFIDNNYQLGSNRYTDYVIESYNEYINYVGNKEPIISFCNKNDKKIYNDELDIAKFEKKGFSNNTIEQEKQELYLKRLLSKSIAVYNIASVYRKRGLRVKIFDGKEYKNGLKILGETIYNVRKFNFYTPSNSEVLDKLYKGKNKLSHFGLSTSTIEKYPLHFYIFKDIARYAQHNNIVKQLKGEFDIFGFKEIVESAEEFINKNKKYQKISEEVSVGASILAFCVPSTMSSILSALGLFFSFLSKQNLADVKDFHLASVVIATSIIGKPFYKNLNVRLKKYYNKFSRIYTNSIDEATINWEQTQRSMKKWTDQSIYVPWYEKHNL